MATDAVLIPSFSPCNSSCNCKPLKETPSPRIPPVSYPYCKNIEFSYCTRSAGVEFFLYPKLSIVPSVSLWSDHSFAMEIRKYFLTKIEKKILDEDDGVFLSMRGSSRDRVSLGFGVSRIHNILTPVFGLSYDIKKEKVSPFIAFKFSF